MFELTQQNWQTLFTIALLVILFFVIRKAVFMVAEYFKNR